MRYHGWLFLLPLSACSLPAPAPPSAEFLVADASSTYWVRSGPKGISARTSPLILTAADHRFYEVYVGEVTRSYEDAIFTRQPIFSRDLVSGRSKLVYEDRRISAWERSYLMGNPGARLLDPDDYESDDVSISATGEAEILAVVGPYLLFDRWATLERGDFQQADSARGAVDIRSGAQVSFTSLVRDSALLGVGGKREGNTVRWRHSGYEVLARRDKGDDETQVVLRDRRGNEWPLGHVNSKLPRIFWLDEPRVNRRVRSALANAFEDARVEDDETQFVSGDDAVTFSPRRAVHRRAREQRSTSRPALFTQ